MAKKVVDITAQDQKAIKALQNDLELYKINIEEDPEDANVHYMKAGSLVKLAKLTKDDSCNSTTLKEALTCFNKAIELSDSKESLYLIDRSSLYIKMNLIELAVADVKKVGELPPVKGIRGAYINYTVGNIKKLEAVQDTIKNLAASGKIDKELANAFQEHVKVTAGLVVQVGEHNDRLDKQDDRFNKNDDRVGGLEALVNQLQKKLQLQENKQFSQEAITQLLQQKTAELKKLQENKELSQEDITKLMQQKIAELQAQLDINTVTVFGLQEEQSHQSQQISDIQTNIQKIGQELDNKLNDYLKKLTYELDHLPNPLSDADKSKIHSYYKAFMETFSSAYVTAQVIDSGQIALDTSSIKVKALSTLASFIPMIGSGLSTTVTSLNDFVQSKEMKSSAKKVKNLASDSTNLSQLVGDSAFAIITNANKQHEIITITDKALEKVTTSLFQKIKAFGEKIGTKVDSTLYGEMYQTPASKLGHNDANTLIEKWIAGKMSVSSADTVKEQFVEEIIQAAQGVFIPVKPQPDHDGNNQNSCCCSIMMVHNIKYENPVLNHPKLLQLFNNLYGAQNLNKLIDFGSQFTSTEDRTSLEEICSSQDAMSNIITMLGLNPSSLEFND